MTPADPTELVISLAGLVREAAERDDFPVRFDTPLPGRPPELLDGAVDLPHRQRVRRLARPPAVTHERHAHPAGRVDGVRHHQPAGFGIAGANTR